MKQVTLDIIFPIMNQAREALRHQMTMSRSQFRLDPCSSLFREKGEIARVGSPVITQSAYRVLCQTPRPKLVGELVEPLELCSCPRIDLRIKLAAVLSSVLLGFMEQV